MDSVPHWRVVPETTGRTFRQYSSSVGACTAPPPPRLPFGDSRGKHTDMVAIASAELCRKCAVAERNVNVSAFSSPWYGAMNPTCIVDDVSGTGAATMEKPPSLELSTRGGPKRSSVFCQMTAPAIAARTAIAAMMTRRLWLRLPEMAGEELRVIEAVWRCTEEEMAKWPERAEVRHQHRGEVLQVDRLREKQSTWFSGERLAGSSRPVGVQTPRSTKQCT